MTELHKNQKTELWKNDVLQDIADHERRVMFYNVPKNDNTEAEVWVDTFIRDHQLTEPQINRLKYTTMKALDNTTQDNRTYKTRHVQVTFPNVDFKGIMFQILIKGGKIPNIKYLKLKDSFPRLYRGKVQEFEKHLSDYRVINGDGTFICIENLQLQGWRIENGKNWVLEKSWTPTEPQDYNRASKNKKSRLPNPKKRLQNQQGTGSSEMETDQQSGQAVLQPGQKLSSAALNNIRLSLLIFVDFNLDENNLVDEAIVAINDLYTAAEIPFVQTKRGAKCIMTLFDSKENLMKGKDALQVEPKPLTFLKFAKLNGH